MTWFGDRSRRLGMAQALGPTLDVSLEPRWGRVHETYGAAPYLAAAFGVDYIGGVQGEDLATGVVASAKHLLGYGASEGGLNSANVEHGSRRIRAAFALPFEAAIQLVDLRSVMNTYSEVNGVPAAAISYELLTTLLRETMQFQGYVSSDYISFQHVVERARRRERRRGRQARASRPGWTSSFPPRGPTGSSSPRRSAKDGSPRLLLDVSATRLLTAPQSSLWASSSSPSPTRSSTWTPCDGRVASSRSRWRAHVTLLKERRHPPAGRDGRQDRRGGAARHCGGPAVPGVLLSRGRAVGVYMTQGGFNNMVGIRRLPARR